MAGRLRTLLQALGLHHDELRLTAGLAWLLQPEGHHRLGDRVLQLFLQRVGVDVPVLHPVRVAREETTEPAQYADMCLDRFQTAWSSLHEHLDRAVADGAEPTVGLDPR